MKRLTAFFVLFLTALCFALTASAADSAIHSVIIDGNAVNVSVTARTDGALWGAVYDESGAMTAANCVNAKGAADAQTLTLSFSDVIPSTAYAKAFLLDAETFAPLCACGGTNIEHAILYADGTLVFQHGDTPQSGREVKETYAVDMEGKYQWGVFAPWHDVADSIERIEFADKIQPKSTAYWFYECSKLKEIGNLNYLDTKNVTAMVYMFSGCEALEALNLSAFNTANVTSMAYMFDHCRSLTALDLSAFDTANVTSMDYMFYECRNLRTLDMSSFNTANVKSMSGMFWVCHSLYALDVSNFNTANVTCMSSMFRSCKSLWTLDVSGFDTSNVTDMSCMFANCVQLRALDLSNFDTSNVTRISWMLSNLPNCTIIYPKTPPFSDEAQ